MTSYVQTYLEYKKSLKLFVFFLWDYTHFKDRITSHRVPSTSTPSKTFSDSSVVKMLPHQPHRTPKLLFLSDWSGLRLPDRNRWEERWGCHYCNVKPPWSRPRIGHEHGMHISVSQSASDTSSGQVDRKCLNCLSLPGLWISFKKKRQVREVEGGKKRGQSFFFCFLESDRSKDRFLSWSFPLFDGNTSFSSVLFSFALFKLKEWSKNDRASLSLSPPSFPNFWQERRCLSLSSHPCIL